MARTWVGIALIQHFCHQKDNGKVSGLRLFVEGSLIRSRAEPALACFSLVHHIQKAMAPGNVSQCVLVLRLRTSWLYLSMTELQENQSFTRHSRHRVKRGSEGSDSQSNFTSLMHRRIFASQHL